LFLPPPSPGGVVAWFDNFVGRGWCGETAKKGDERLGGGGGVLVGCSCLAPLTRRLSIPILPLGTRFEIPRDLWAPPSLHWAGTGSPGVIAVDGLTPYPWQAPVRAVSGIRGGQLHIQKHLHLLADKYNNASSYIYWSIRLPFHLWCSFSVLCLNFAVYTHTDALLGGEMMSCLL